MQVVREICFAFAQRSMMEGVLGLPSCIGIVADDDALVHTAIETNCRTYLSTEFFGHRVLTQPSILSPLHSSSADGRSLGLASRKVAMASCSSASFLRLTLTSPQQYRGRRAAWYHAEVHRLSFSPTTHESHCVSCAAREIDRDRSWRMPTSSWRPFPHPFSLSFFKSVIVLCWCHLPILVTLAPPRFRGV